MPRPSRNTELAVWGLLGLTVLAIVVAFVRERLQGSALALGLPALFSVPAFSLTNQTGQRFESRELAGKVWVADVIFTTCAGPCPRMTALMAELQAAIHPASAVRFVSVTTDPERDTPAVLARYATRHGADPSRWHFLTGSPDQIRAAAVDGLKFTVLPTDPVRRESPTDLFIHSTLFVVVDKRGWVRGSFELDEPGARERITAVINDLLKESP